MQTRSISKIAVALLTVATLTASVPRLSDAQSGVPGGQSPAVARLAGTFETVFVGRGDLYRPGQRQGHTGGRRRRMDAGWTRHVARRRARQNGSDARLPALDRLAAGARIRPDCKYLSGPWRCAGRRSGARPPWQLRVRIE